MMCQLGILSRRGGRAERCIGAAAPVALRRGSDGRKHRDPLGLGGGPSLGRKSCPLRDAGSRLSRDGAWVLLPPPEQAVVDRIAVRRALIEGVFLSPISVFW